MALRPGIKELNVEKRLSMSVRPGPLAALGGGSVAPGSTGSPRLDQNEPVLLLTTGATGLTITKSSATAIGVVTIGVVVVVLLLVVGMPDVSGIQNPNRHCVVAAQSTIHP